MSEQWEEFHTCARNSIESVNNDIKDEGHEGTAARGRRRVRGFAGGGVIAAILLTQYNLRTIATFIKETVIAEQLNKPDGPPEKIQRRRELNLWNKYTNTLPKEPLLDLWSRGELRSQLRT